MASSSSLLQDWFAGNPLVWHISAAVQFPLAEDEQACKWLLHESSVLQSSATQAIPAADLLALVKFYDDSGEYWKEARLLNVFVSVTELPKAEAIKHYKNIVRMLGKVKEDKDDPNEKERYAMESGAALSVSLLEGPGSADFQWAAGHMIAMYKSGKEMGAMVKGVALFFLAFPLLGVTPSLVDPTSAQRYEGQQYFRESCRMNVAAQVRIRAPLKHTSPLWVSGSQADEKRPWMKLKYQFMSYTSVHVFPCGKSKPAVHFAIYEAQCLI